MLKFCLKFRETLIFASHYFCSDFVVFLLLVTLGLPQWLSGQRIRLQCRMKEKRVWSLGHEDPLEKGMATHSNILAWRIPWTEEPGGALVHMVTNSWMQLKWLNTHTHIHTHTIIISLSISSFRSTSIYLMYLDALMLGTYVFKIFCLLNELTPFIITYIIMLWSSLSLIIQYYF